MSDGNQLTRKLFDTVRGIRKGMNRRRVRDMTVLDHDPKHPVLSQVLQRDVTLHTTKGWRNNRRDNS